MIDAGEIVGRITSIARRSTVGYPIALALLHPDFAHAGTAVKIRLDDGQLVEARVTTLPFYDPDNARQGI